MKLRELLSGLQTRSTTGDMDVEILGFAYDSREVSRGFLFIAVRGTRMDGNRYVPQAIAKGAAGVVSAVPRIESLAMPWIQVDDERSALAALAGNFYGHPTRKLHLVGVTGTNGKTVLNTNDTVVIAGKGHETYQTVGTTSFPFDDRVVVRELLDELVAGRN